MGMTKELKQQWIEALRSGEYKQIKNILKDEIGYCCLGVLCDIIPDWTISEDGDSVVELGRYNTYDKIEKILGVDSTTLTTMNDDDGKTFAEIADYIEQNIIAE